MENHFYSAGPRKDITINKSVLSSFIIEPGANTIILLNAVINLKGAVSWSACQSVTSIVI